MTKLLIDTPRWAVPLLEPKRYKGTKGGRSSGKSHFWAELLVETMVRFPNTQAVCIREIQKSLKFSAKKLVEDKIRKLKVSHLFKITQNEITRIGHQGIIIFQGMQDHTADSIKSLEGFDIAWVEEAQSMSKRSIELLVPTIRNDGSEIWFSWNPDQPGDAVEELFYNNEDAICIHVNYLDNPWCPQVMLKEARRVRDTDYEKYEHVWLGGLNTRSDAQIFGGCYEVKEFTPKENWEGPYYGLDWGFGVDPTAAVKTWVSEEVLYIEYEAGKVGLELDDTAEYLIERIPDIERHTVRADSARPESISFVKRHGLPRIVPVDKGKGSVEDGIEHIKSYKRVVIHSRCKEVLNEFKLYYYKIDKASGDILPDVVDAFNHFVDAIRYALRPLMSRGKLKISASTLNKARS